MVTGSLAWRAMTATDEAAVIAIADEVHACYPEDQAVFTNRRELYSDGCLVLERESVIFGYLISHPWLSRRPPALNVVLDRIPSPATTYYIHDLVILPAVRKSGAAAAVVNQMAAHATGRKLRNMSLVAVNNSVHFWESQRFRISTAFELAQKLESYGADARYMIRDLT